MARSRLSKRLEQKTKKNLFFSLLGIILVIFLALRFGVPLLVNLSLFLSGFQNKEQIKIQSPSFIAPPVLDSSPQATGSADIVITGAASKNQSISLYINDELVDKTKTEDNGRFSFKETLSPGENSIKTKAVVEEKESAFSNIIAITFKSAPPFLNLKSPSDSQTFSKDQNFIEVLGITDPEAKVTVNGFWAITDSSGEFSYNLPLKNGENKIKIIASDPAGNKTEKEIRVTYSP